MLRLGRLVVLDFLQVLFESLLDVLDSRLLVFCTVDSGDHRPGISLWADGRHIFSRFLLPVGWIRDPQDGLASLANDGLSTWQLAGFIRRRKSTNIGRRFAEIRMLGVLVFRGWIRIPCATGIPNPWHASATLRVAPTTTPALAPFFAPSLPPAIPPTIAPRMPLRAAPPPPPLR